MGMSISASARLDVNIPPGSTLVRAFQPRISRTLAGRTRFMVPDDYGMMLRGRANRPPSRTRASLLVAAGGVSDVRKRLGEAHSVMTKASRAVCGHGIPRT
jgi:hypothetical protein